MSNVLPQIFLSGSKTWTNWLDDVSQKVTSSLYLFGYLNRCPAELPQCRPRRVVDEQWFAVPEAPTPGVHPATECCDRRLRCCNVVVLAVLVGLVPAALVVVVVVASVAAALTWTHAGHSAQRASQLPPRTATGQFCPKTIGDPCWRTDIMGSVLLNRTDWFESFLTRGFYTPVFTLIWMQSEDFKSWFNSTSTLFQSYFCLIFSENVTLYC